MEARRLQAQFCLFCGRQVVIFQPPGVWQEYRGLGVQGDTETSGKIRPMVGSRVSVLTYLPLSLRILISSGQNGRHWGWGQGGGGKSCQGAFYLMGF